MMFKALCKSNGVACRDPRARRLAERQARAPALPIPEQLSFKEKMKMFALESGEASTPKDKVQFSKLTSLHETA